MKAACAPCVVLLWLVVAARASLAQPLEVRSVTPAAHSLTSAVNTTIEVVFDRAVDPATIDATSFWALGRHSGPRAGNYAFSNGGTTVKLTPATSFAAGETVTVLLSNQIKDTLGVPLRSAGYSYQFWIRTEPASFTFTLIADMSTGTPSRPYGGSAATFDADAFVDLAIVNEASNDVRIFINQGDGSGSYDPFLPPETVGDTPSPSEIGDFNRDGLIDLCVANVSGGSVSVMLGNGDGTFGAHTEIVLGLDATGIAVLDVDGDGDLDIATAGGFVHVLVNVDLTPTPDIDSTFAAWSGALDCSDGSVSMSLDLSCTAAFALVVDLILEDLTLNGVEQIDACNSITTGQNVVVTSTGDTTLGAGSFVALGSGFSVEVDGELQVVLKPGFCS